MKYTVTFKARAIEPPGARLAALAVLLQHQRIEPQRLICTTLPGTLSGFWIVVLDIGENEVRPFIVALRGCPDFSDVRAEGATIKSAAPFLAAESFFIGDWCI